MAQPATQQPLTDQQHAAIHSRGVSVALSAGAGCGKTFVLTHRFLSELEPGAAADLSQVVAITFTERAAREMRDRIRLKCRQRLLAASAGGEEEHWLALTRELDGARVSTIHSFCASLLRAHAVEAGLDPQFAVCEPQQASTLRAEVIDDELRRQYSAGSQALIDLSVGYGLATIRGMLGILLANRGKLDLEAWSQRTAEQIVTKWQEFCREQIAAAVERLAGSSDFAALLAIVRVAAPTNAGMLDRCRELTSLLPQLKKAAEPMKLLGEIRERAQVQKGTSAKHWPDADSYQSYRDTAARLRTKIDKLLERLQLDDASAHAAAVAGLQLLEVGRPVLDAYAARKDALGLLDFDDLLYRAHDLLCDPHNQRLADRVAAGLKLLLVDEFQDTDPLQVRIIEALCGKALTQGKLFFVGDYKQSIYRFRGADPRVFRALREEVPEQGRLPLTRNFRSQPAILRFVNALMRDELGPAYEPLVPERPQLAPEPAVEFLWAIAGDDTHGVKEAKSDHRRREAEWIARRLRAILDSGEKIIFEKPANGGAPSLRAPRPGDIALVFRALSDLRYYEEALRRHGLEYYVVGGRAFYAQQEVFDVLNLLRAVASSADEISLAGALRSPLFSLKDETLFWLAQAPGGLSAAIASELPVPQIAADELPRVRFAAATLAELRGLKDRLPIAELVREALARTGYDAVLLAEFMGERKLANLHKLVEQARGMDRAGIFTLADFIEQLSEFVATEPDEALAATHAETANVIRLMSIHQSKGLEFPIVVVPDLERENKPSNSPLCIDPNLGPLVKPPGGSGTCGLTLVRYLEDAEDKAEHARLLYVAATRAADYLILSSGMENIDEPKGPWTQLLAARFDLSTGQVRVPLEAGEMPRVKVTMTEPEILGEPAGAERRDLKKLIEIAHSPAERRRAKPPPSLAPIVPDATAPRGYSFSQLSGALEAFDLEEPPPGTMRPQQAASGLRQGDALRIGTLAHAVLATYDLAQSPGMAGAVAHHAQRQPLVQAGEGQAVTKMLERFAASSRARVIAGAAQVFRELDFIFSWPPEGEASGSYIQGVIDCLYQDAAGAWHVVDYKTNDLEAGGLEKIAGRYELQMLVYAWAVERILGQAPASATLVFLRSGEEYPIAWNAAARSRCRELLTRAIAALAARPDAAMSPAEAGS